MTLLCNGNRAGSGRPGRKWPAEQESVTSGLIHPCRVALERPLHPGEINSMKSLRLKFAATTAALAVVGALVPGISVAQAPEETVLFEGEGRIKGMNPLSTDLIGITYGEFFFACLGEPLSQGVDGWVFDPGAELPAGSVASLTGQNPIDDYDLDMYFFDAECFEIGAAASASVDEVAAVPAGTRYVVATAWFGAHTLAKLKVTAGAPAPEPTPTPSATGEPVPDPDADLYLRGDYSQTPNDPMFAEQWNMDAINAYDAWQEEQATGYNIKISVVDSGVDHEHPDFACDYKMNVLPGSDTGESDDDPLDADGHGTHVNGIAGACVNNGTGVVGVAPDSILQPVKVFGYPTGVGFGFNPADLDAAMAKGIRFATESGSHVINLSIGDIPPFSHLGPDGYPETEEALAEAREAGVVIAAAAGNFDQPTCEFPSLSRNVICVVATGPDDSWATYSDLAVNVDRNADEPGLEPVVAAPGGAGYESLECNEGIISTYWRDGAHGSCSEANGYDWLSGTSMASPHVAGLAALLYDRLGGERSKATADQIVQIIMDTANDLGAPGYDPQFGFGRINALEAILSVDPVQHAIYPAPAPF